MKNNAGSLATVSSVSSIEREEKILLGASCSKLEALKLLAGRVLETKEIAEAHSLAREQVALLNELIAESEAQTERLYEWANA